MRDYRAELSAQRRATLVLQIAVAGACLAGAWISWTQYSPLNSLLFMQLGVSEALATGVDRASAVLLVGVALAALTSRARGVLVLGALWFLAQAIATSLSSGERLAELAPFAHSARYVAPLALLGLLSGRALGAARGLRLAAALTFAAHGVEALAQLPVFLDLVLLTARRFGASLSEAEAGNVLYAIGIVDLCVAGLVLLRGGRIILFYMALWGALTLCSRLTAGGLEQWPVAVIRLANAGAPLALLFLHPVRERTRGSAC